MNKKIQNAKDIWDLTESHYYLDWSWITTEKWKTTSPSRLYPSDTEMKFFKEDTFMALLNDLIS